MADIDPKVKFEKNLYGGLSIGFASLDGVLLLLLILLPIFLEGGDRDSVMLSWYYDLLIGLFFACLVVFIVLAVQYDKRHQIIDEANEKEKEEQAKRDAVTTEQSNDPQI
ncbi:MAG: hypothetical protein LUD22_01710 [Coprobacillus sp.]|nr:hypothetical protein [Coprobacillus sp.]